MEDLFYEIRETEKLHKLYDNFKYINIFTIQSAQMEAKWVSIIHM